VNLIENATAFCLPVGDERFKQQIDKVKDGITLGKATRERPRKAQETGYGIIPPAPISSY
jgi:hypothetical protein